MTHLERKIAKQKKQIAKLEREVHHEMKVERKEKLAKVRRMRG